MDPRTAPCRSCNAPMIWAKNVATGRQNPLDANPEAEGKTRYIVRSDGRETTCEKVTEPTDEPTYVSHFETCPNANQHSRKNAS